VIAVCWVDETRLEKDEVGTIDPLWAVPLHSVVMVKVMMD
jgi:hypothetical protein